MIHSSLPVVLTVPGTITQRIAAYVTNGDRPR